MIERTNILYRNNVFSEYGLKGYQANYLLVINKNPGISQEQLTKDMHIDKSNVARGLIKLSESGYIMRIQDTNDLRCILLYPTDIGITLAHKISLIFKKQHDYILQDFDETELAKLMEYLEKLKLRASELLEIERSI